MASKSQHVGDPANDGARASGAVFRFDFVDEWVQTFDIKASNTDELDAFGSSLAVTRDYLAVGARGEDSRSRFIDGDEGDSAISDAGAAYARGLEVTF